jgi:hypothetical protein
MTGRSYLENLCEVVPESANLRQDLAIRLTADAPNYDTLTSVNH